MTTRVVHCKLETYDVLIDRSTIWGNPYSYKQGTKARYIVATRDEAIDKYKEWVLSQPQLMRLLPTLKGKRLGCWCKTKQNPNRRCHGDILVELVNKLE